MRYTTVLSVDPGRDKCGVAVVSSHGVVSREIIPTELLPTRLPKILAMQAVDAILVGDGTGSKDVVPVLRELSPDKEIIAVKESHSSERARARYFIENPPRGLRKLIPRGLLFPDTPYDDLVSIILAEDFLCDQNSTCS